MPARRTVLASAGLVPLLVVIPTAAQEATPVPDPNAIESERDVVYGEVDGEALLMDIHRPPLRDAPRPAVVLIYGGGWTTGYGSRFEMDSPAKKLAEAGYVAFNSRTAC